MAIQIIQTAVSAYFSNKQILSIGFAEYNTYTVDNSTRVSMVISNVFLRYSAAKEFGVITPYLKMLDCGVKRCHNYNN